MHTSSTYTTAQATYTRARDAYADALNHAATCPSSARDKAMQDVERAQAAFTIATAAYLLLG